MKENNTNEKLTDEAFSRLMITSVLGILVCIICLCSATWAWFGSDISNDSNKVASGVFALEVTVTDGAVIIASADTNDGEVIVKIPEAEREYTVTLKMTDNTTVTKGYCTLRVGEKTFQTASIRVDESNPFIFYIKVREPNTTVTFTPSWGLPANEAVGLNGTLEIDTTP